MGAATTSGVSQEKPMVTISRRGWVLVSTASLLIETACSPNPSSGPPARAQPSAQNGQMNAGERADALKTGINRLAAKVGQPDALSSSQVEQTPPTHPNPQH
jgi:hypothetical protein